MRWAEKVLAAVAVFRCKFRIKNQSSWVPGAFPKESSLLLWYSSVTECMFCMGKVLGNREERETEKHRETEKVSRRRSGQENVERS